MKPVIGAGFKDVRAYEQGGHHPDSIRSGEAFEARVRHGAALGTIMGNQSRQDFYADLMGRAGTRKHWGGEVIANTPEVGERLFGKQVVKTGTEMRDFMNGQRNRPPDAIDWRPENALDPDNLDAALPQGVRQVEGEYRGGNLGMDEVPALKRAFTPPFRLERPQGSCLHDVITSEVVLPNTHQKFRLELENLDKCLVFLVEHDWAALVPHADLMSAELRLPAPLPVFEFVVNGVRCIASMDEGRPGVTLMVRIDKGKYFVLPVVRRDDGMWRMPLADKGYVGMKGTRELLDFVDLQVRATCAMLDAEVAVREVVRAPHKLNRARERRGRAPVRDWNVVRLAHRHRVAPAGERASEEKRTSPRLHFRRGHWVHYGESKTWRRWTLVGDESLGWIDKYYRA